MHRAIHILVVLAAGVCGVVPSARAQVATGTIAGIVLDSGGGVLPGVGVSLSGDRVIRGTETQTTDASGAYRFDRLTPGTCTLKFELQGFKAIERRGIVVSGSFTTTVNVSLEVGRLEETITVSGASPTVDRSLRHQHQRQLHSERRVSFQSQYAITRAIFPTLTRASQTVRLSERGVERLPDVRMIDLRVSRTFRFAERRLTPMIEVFNLGNADTIVGYNNNVGTTYRRPTEILSPRIVRAGVTLDF